MGKKIAPVVQEMPQEPGGPRVLMVNPAGKPRPIDEILTEQPNRQPAAPEVKGKWRVSLACPTPLAYRELVVEAADEAGAMEAFCRANNISGSAHDWSIKRVAE